MPAVVVGAAASAALGAAAGGLSVAASVLLNFTGSLVLGALSSALSPKPKKPSISNIKNQIGSSTVAIRQSDLSRQHVYGHTRVTRGFAHMWSSDSNGNLHVILILCEGPLRAINEVWVNDYAIPNDWIDSNGAVTQGRYSGYLTIRKHLGEEDQAADSLAVSNLSEWTSDHKLSGTAYLYLILKKSDTVYPTGFPNFSAIVEGPELFDPRIEDSYGIGWSTNIALYARDYMTNETYGFGASEEDFDDDNISAQANICDEIVDTTEKTFIVSSINATTDIITLSGTILELCFGDRVRIQSTGSYPGNLSSGDEYYIIPYQVKDTPRIKLAASLDDSMAKTAIDISSVGSGTITIIKTGEPRYHGSGVIDTEKTLSDNLNDIVASMAGRAVNIGGYWTLLAGAWRTPQETFTVGDMKSAIGIKRSLPMSDSYNVVKGLFIGPASFYQQTDYPSARYDTFINEDLIESTKELNLAFVDRATTAQRIAKIELFKARQDIVFTNDFSMRAYRLQPGSNTGITIERFGWSDKKFEVTELAFDIVNNALVSRLTLRETAQEIFDWSAGEAINFDPAPNTLLPDPFDVSVVLGFSVDSVPIYTQSGDRVFNVVASWDIHENQYVVNGGKYEIRFKETTEDQYKSAGFVDGNVTSMRIPALQIDVLYDIEIIAYNKLGRPSASTIINNFQVGTTVITTTEDWENEILSRDGDDLESDSLSTEDWE